MKFILPLVILSLAVAGCSVESSVVTKTVVEKDGLITETIVSKKVEAPKLPKYTITIDLPGVSGSRAWCQSGNDFSFVNGGSTIRFTTVSGKVVFATNYVIEENY